MHLNWFDPIFFSLGPLQIHWYGFLYVFAFVLGGVILRQLAREKFWPLPTDDIDMYISWLIIGMFLGARLSYVFIYNWEYFSDHFSDILKVWKGGLSFHGAVMGMCLVSWLFARRKKLHFFQVSDCLAIAGSQGIFWGRIGNFINGELYGRITDSWVGVSFPGGGPFPRHPSQIYEGVLEGVFIFLILYALHRRQRFYGVVTGAFLGCYGGFRFLVEFFREPDPQLGYYLNYFTMGQLLSLLMIPAAIWILVRARQIKLLNPLIPSR
jgi:phosphatidylglycerol---prolipoprotein diacylglyceryl transferase